VVPAGGKHIIIVCVCVRVQHKADTHAG
jgi:hypothetical protein